MTITLYRTADADNVLHKTLTPIKNITGAICKDNISILNPVFILAYDSNIALANYLYCAEFSRYYAITDITLMTGGRVQISAHVDVLQTYGAALVQLSALMTRAETEPSEIVDNFLPLKRNKITKVYEFSGGDFNIDTATNTDYNFVLNIMGGGVDNTAKGEGENVGSK